MADILAFPAVRARLPMNTRNASGFAVRVIYDGEVWLVVARNHSWAHASRNQAIRDGSDIASGFGAPLVIEIGRRT
jgi:hypothetical protein